jgi:hypothetical protein
MVGFPSCADDRQERLARENPEKFQDCTLVPVIWGADKTVASVATGHNDFYPLYMSNGAIHNDVRRAHDDGLELIALLPIPKGEWLRQFKHSYLCGSRCPRV